jgi:uncharacterized paraquat-inducible protein A
MNTLLERLESMGARGGALAIGLAIAAALLAVGLGALSFTLTGWVTMPLRLVAALLLPLAGVFALIGARAVSAPTYPSAAETFPPLDATAFRDALTRRDEPVCACTRCRVVLSAAFSTGSCPVCNSGVDFYEVNTDEDAQMVLLAIG